jgi:hypothetical protein
MLVLDKNCMQMTKNFEEKVIICGEGYKLCVAASFSEKNKSIEGRCEFIRYLPHDCLRATYIKCVTTYVSPKRVFTSVINHSSCQKKPFSLLSFIGRALEAGRLEPIVNVECIPENNPDRLFGRRFATFVSLAKVQQQAAVFKPLR